MGSQTTSKVVIQATAFYVKGPNTDPSITGLERRGFIRQGCTLIYKRGLAGEIMVLYLPVPCCRGKSLLGLVRV